MEYINGVGYVDERSYHAALKTKKQSDDNFNSILQKETIVYAIPESSNSEKTTAVLSSTDKTTSPESLEAFFQKAANEYGIDINLLKAIAKQESNYDPTAVSTVGASGIMQLMPSTAQEMGVENIMDPEQNIMGGAKYLSQMLQTFNGNVSLALAAYNAGPGNVKKYNGIPPFQETQNYVNKVLENYRELNSANYATLITQEQTASANTIYSILVSDATKTPKIVNATPTQDM
ncbi:MAG: lytic transglycosylase domain-containing protein [Lachnospiraceae bacterium]